MAKHHGKSETTIEKAVEDALKGVGGSADFAFELRVSAGPTPGKITYHVTLTSP
jgi:hypothetical protein